MFLLADYYKDGDKNNPVVKVFVAEDAGDPPPELSTGGYKGENNATLHFGFYDSGDKNNVAIFLVILPDDWFPFQSRFKTCTLTKDGAGQYLRVLSDQSFVSGNYLPGAGSVIGEYLRYIGGNIPVKPPTSLGISNSTLTSTAKIPEQTSGTSKSEIQISDEKMKTKSSTPKHDEVAKISSHTKVEILESEINHVKVLKDGLPSTDPNSILTETNVSKDKGVKGVRTKLRTTKMDAAKCKGEPEAPEKRKDDANEKKSQKSNTRLETEKTEKTFVAETTKPKSKWYGALICKAKKSTKNKTAKEVMNLGTNLKDIDIDKDKMSPAQSNASLHDTMAAANSTIVNKAPRIIRLEGQAAVKSAEEKQARHDLEQHKIEHKREIEVSSINTYYVLAL